MRCCGRCGVETSILHMSWFNTDELCLLCQEDEQKHPDLGYAKVIEHAATKAGNTNFPGVGWPGINGRVTNTPDGVKRAP